MKAAFLLALSAISMVAAAPADLRARQGELGNITRVVIITLPGGVTVTRTVVAPGGPAPTDLPVTRTVIPAI